MGLTLNILSSGAQPGRETVFSMMGEAMTLGRAETNDVVLPDPTREISSSHAVVQYRNGDFLIVDTSTNGTFLNGEGTPLGDLPTPLNHGDILRIGAYELQVSIAAAVQSADPFADLPPPVGEEAIVQDRGGTALDEIAGIDTSGGDFLDDILGSTPPNAARMERPSGVDADDRSIDDFLDIEADPNRAGGASAPNHSSPAQDFFSAGAAGGAIPDDWDDEFLSGLDGGAQQGGGSGSGSGAGSGAGGGGAAGGLIPETSFDDNPFEIPASSDPFAGDAPLADPPGEDPIDALLNARAQSGLGGTGQDDAPAEIPPQPGEVPPPVRPDIPEPLPEVPPETPQEDPAPQRDPDPGPVPDPVPGPVPETPPAPRPNPGPAPRPAADPTPPPAAANADLARRFLDAAGVDHSRIDDTEMGEVMDRAGRAFRTFVEGAREVLMARKQVKDELRLGQTMISPDGNNPIKFSISGQQAVEAMIKPTVAGYQPGDRAAAEAMRDIKAHEVAMMSGMETAIKALLARFDPEALGGTIEKSGALGGLLRNKKARYWDAFETLYSRISEDAEEDFNVLFGKSFASAYKEQLTKLKAEETEL